MAARLLLLRLQQGDALLLVLPEFNSKVVIVVSCDGVIFLISVDWINHEYI